MLIIRKLKLRIRTVKNQAVRNTEMFAASHQIREEYASAYQYVSRYHTGIILRAFLTTKID